MRRTVRTVVGILFVGVILACGFAILYFGTSTGMVFGGAGTELTVQSKANPMYAQVGWIRNTAPWPITITSITTDSAHSTAPAEVYLERKHLGSKAYSGKAPEWTLLATTAPYQLDGHGLRYLGFALTPAEGKVASLSSVTVNFSGPLGLRFHKTFTGTVVATASSTLPSGTLATDPTIDSTSLDTYIALLRTALFNGDPGQLAVVMGGTATPADATAFLKSQNHYKTKFGVTAVAVTGDLYSDTLDFYKGDPVKDARPAFKVTWAGFRWSVVLPAKS
jgi:hypothetical protein